MRANLLALIVGITVMLSADAYFVANPPDQLAAAVTANPQVNSILTSRLIELLRQLVVLRTQQASLSTAIPFATTTPLPSQKSGTSIAVLPAKKAATLVSTPVSIDAAQQQPTEKALGLVLPNLRSALVNIVCLPVTQGNGVRGISGSGIIIDPHGIILTVAHVAQYELLAEARPDLVGCFVRSGSPAAFAYKARPIYISNAWVSQNSQTISTTDPKGTGENDFALLAITSSDTRSSLPVSFPYVPISPTVSNLGDPVVIGSYGAEFLTSARIRDDLFPTLVYGSVHDHFTFMTTTIDLLSLGGGAAAQQGSSGGGIMNQSGQLAALITTSSSGSDLANRDLHAITTTYIERAFRQDSGFDLNAYITGANPMTLANAYASTAAQLGATLIKANSLK